MRDKDLLNEVGRVERCLAGKDEELGLAIRSCTAPGHVTRRTLVPAVNAQIILHVHSSCTGLDQHSVPPAVAEGVCCNMAFITVEYWRVRRLLFELVDDLGSKNLPLVLVLRC